jgi:hypothetical protein
MTTRDRRIAAAVVVAGVLAAAVIAAGATLALGRTSPSKSAGGYIDDHETYFPQVQSAMRAFGARLKHVEQTVPKNLSGFADNVATAQDGVIELSGDIFLGIPTTTASQATDETFAGQGVSDLTGAMAALIIWSEHPDDTRLDDAIEHYETAEREWNNGVTSLWQLAGRGGSPPTV